MRFAILAFLAAAAYGQTPRVFQLTQNQSPQDVDQIAAMLRLAGDFSQVSADAAGRTVKVEGASAQVAKAEWLVRQLDLPATGPFSGIHEYRTPDSGDDVLSVLYLPHASGRLDLIETVTAIRLTSSTPYLFAYSPVNAVMVRGSSQQVALATWLVDWFNQSGTEAAPGANAYTLAGGDKARIFQLATPRSPREAQELVTLLRSVGDIQRIFSCTSRHAVVMRGSAEQLELAAWLIHELDRPSAGGSAAAGAAPPEFHLSRVSDNLVKVYYLKESQPPQETQRVATQVRAASGAQRLFVYSALDALAVRGTAEQINTVERMIREVKAQ